MNESPDKPVFDCEAFGNKELWKIGQTAYFEYHCYRAHDSSDAEAWYRDHQAVEVIGMPDSDGKNMLLEEGANAAERAEAGCPLMYTARFRDNHEHQVYEDELYINPSFFDPELGPPSNDEIQAARSKNT